jgi:hypothetical protein
MEHMDSPNLLPILIGFWAAGITYDDFANFIEFRSDGTGTMGGILNRPYFGRPTVTVNFSFQVLPEQLIQFEFFDTRDEFQRSEENSHRVTGFRLLGGTFYQSDYRSYQYRLVFDTEPFPVGYEPKLQLSEYFGHWGSEYPE